MSAEYEQAKREAHDAYRAAMAADAAYSRALQERFGKNGPSYYRYRPDGQAGDLAPYAEAKLKADAKMRETTRRLFEMTPPPVSSVLARR